MQLRPSEIRTSEVLDWKGLHLFHGRMSSCSQKLRIFLNLKGIEWQGHELNLAQNETYSDYFMGINPRGLVPVVVLDGEVHIESNDILTMLEKRFPEPCLIPKDQAEEIACLLEQEDDLHIALRTLSFRFVFGRMSSNKSPELLTWYENYECTIAGNMEDVDRKRELHFYRTLEERGLTDEMARTAILKFHKIFDDFESILSTKAYLLGDNLTIIDIAWFVYVSRLHLGGYPFARLHPNIEQWRRGLASDDRFAKEVMPPDPIKDQLVKNQQRWINEATTISHIGGI